MDLRGELPAQLTGRISGAGPGRHDLALAVNGRVATVSRSFPWEGQERFSAFAPPQAFRSGRNLVEVFLVPPCRAATAAHRSGLSHPHAACSLYGSAYRRRQSGRIASRPRRRARTRRGMAAVEELATGELQELARKHLWMHFTRMGAFDEEHEIPIIVRGDGCYVYDQHGRRYLDGLSALYCVNIGHGRADVAQAGADQAKELGFFTNWGYAHPKCDRARRARSPASRPATSTASSSPPAAPRRSSSALKLCRQYHKLTGNPGRYKVIARKLAYHGTTMGALTATGIPDARRPFEPLFPGSAHVANTNPYRPEVDDPAEAIRERIEFEGPETVSCVILEPVQNSGGCFGPPRRLLPARARDLRRVRDPVHLRRGDLLLGPAGRVLRRRALRLRARHHHDRQGPDLVVRADGRGDRLRPRVRAVREGTTSFLHGITFGGHPVASAVALANLDVFEREGLLENVRANEGAFGAMLDSLRDIPIVGDVRGMGYFWAIELVRDRATKADVLRGRVRVAAARLPVRRDLPPRADLPRRRPRRPGDPARAAADRRAEQFEEIEGAVEWVRVRSVLRPALEEASRRLDLD